MRKWIILTTLTLLQKSLCAQIGFHMNVVEFTVGKEQIINTRSEGDWIVQDIRTGFKEVSMLFYNKDSSVVALACGMKDSFYTDSFIATMLKNNLPDFVTHKTAVKGAVTFYSDTLHHLLFTVNHASAAPKSAIIGYGFVTDPVIIEVWLQGVEFKDE